MAILDWWINDAGDNALAGVEGDPNNPIRASAEDILYHLGNSADARASFDYLLPTMLPEEQTRLNAIRALTPNPLFTNRQIADIQQSSWNKMGVHANGRF